MAADLRIYIDYKSPYAYLIKDPAYELEREFGVEFTWLPYVLEIPDFLGTVEGRNPINGAASATATWTPAASRIAVT